MRAFSVATLAIAVAAILPARPAHAHLALSQPASRYGPSILKTGPCGMAGGQRSQNVAVFEAGETIEVVWDEYVNHPGHFRVSFDDDGDDDFVDPPCLANCNSTNPTIEFYSAPSVLMDQIPDTAGGGETHLMVTLPNVVCDNCTLQAIQVMYDKPPYTLPGNDIYYQCADLILVAPGGGDAGVADGGMDTPDAGPPADAGAEVDAGSPMDAQPGVDTGTPDTGAPRPDAGFADTGAGGNDDGGGCACVSPATGATGWLLLPALLGLLGWRKRR